MPVPVPSSQKADPTTLAKVTVTANAGYDANDPYHKDYAVPDSFAATKTDTPIMETPASIQAVSRAVMDDQEVISLNDALKNVSGVQVADAFYDGAIIRGFDTKASTYRNGLRQAAVSNLETANLSSIEVLKGPASVLYGRIEPGGLINLAPKRALEIPYFFMQSGAKITTQFNVYNIRDKTYYDRSSSRLAVYPAQPLTLLGSIRVEY